VVAEQVKEEGTPSEVMQEIEPKEVKQEQGQGVLEDLKHA
jgi:hypothetical protein